MIRLGRIIFFASLLGSQAQADSFATLDQQITRIKAEEDISALAYGIVGGDDVMWQRTLGHYSVDRRRPIDINTLFRVGSITKSFTALAALLLEHQAQFTTDSPVKHILDPVPFTNHWKERAITVDMLLEHTAGFTDLSKQEFDYPRPLPLYDAFSLYPHSRTTRWQPGLHSSYSNSGAGIVAAVIETVSRMPFEQCLEELIFTPMGQESATLEPPTPMYANLVKGYDRDGKTPIPYWHQLYRAFGALNISTADMLKYALVLLNEGRYEGQQVFPREVVKRMTRVTTGLASSSGLKYGYAKGLYHFQRHGVSFYGHGGDADGYLAFLAFSKQIDRGYFIVFNAFNPPAMGKFRKAIEDTLTAETEMATPAEYKMSAREVQTLQGEYESVTQRFPQKQPALLSVSMNEEGKLVTRIGDANPRQLVPVSARLFRRPKQTVATSALSEHEGQIYLHGDFGNFRKRPAEGHLQH